MFGRFRKQIIDRKKYKEPLSFLQEQEIKTTWLRLIHQQLYAKVNLQTRGKAIENHVYLPSFLPLIKSSSMTVNYNFDDTLEKMLQLARSTVEQLTTRGYETVFKPNAQVQRDNGVIYHPNGFLPSIFEDGCSPDLVFADDSFQDQLISVASGQYIQLSNFLFRNTCLLIGLSLSDTTLQHLLRQNAVSNPGHIHYVTHFVEDDQAYDPVLFEAIFDANFSAYNVFTLFLDRKGLKLLAETVSTPSDTLPLRFPRAKHKFVYYIIGSIGVGKSTAASNMRCLTTYDEWIDERRPDMAVPEAGLTRDNIREINDWTAEQFRKKNVAVMRSPSGIHLIDRCPLDPLTFGQPSERKKKAEKLVSTITSAGRERIQRGHIILLEADLSDLKNRMSLKHKYWADSDLGRLLKRITDVYAEVPKTILSTRGRSAPEVVRELAKIIFVGDYNPVDVAQHLKRFQKSSARKPKPGKR